MKRMLSYEAGIDDAIALILMFEATKNLDLSRLTNQIKLLKEVA